MTSGTTDSTYTGADTDVVDHGYVAAVAAVGVDVTGLGGVSRELLAAVVAAADPVTGHRPPRASRHPGGRWHVDTECTGLARSQPGRHATVASLAR